MIVKVTSKNAIRRLPEREWQNNEGISCNRCYHPESAVYEEDTDSWHCPLHNNKLICQSDYITKKNGQDVHFLSTYICNDFQAHHDC